MYNLCCISEELKKENICFKTMTWARFCELRDANGLNSALQELGERWLNNIKVTGRVVEHCVNNNWGYRVSSSLMPLLTHPDFPGDSRLVPQYQQILEEFNKIKNYLADKQIRISCHPDQFNVLASKNQDAVNKTIKELNFHGAVLDLLGCKQDYSCPINIHVNCSDGTPEEIAQRFVANMNKCNKSVRSRLVVENEDRGMWNVAMLLEHFWNGHKIPITFDNLHDKCNPSTDTVDAFSSCADTWKTLGYVPLFHYSESSANDRKHADMPTSTPYLEFGEDANKVDFDIELKAKDAAIRFMSAIPHGKAELYKHTGVASSDCCVAGSTQDCCVPSNAAVYNESVNVATSDASDEYSMPLPTGILEGKLKPKVPKRPW
jgi:UV DNA damage endonuclease